MRHLVRLLTRPTLLAVLIVYVLIIWCTYFTVELLFVSKGLHHSIIVATHWIFGYTFTIIILGQLRLGLHFSNQKFSKGIDIFLGLLFWLAFGAILLASLIPIGFMLGIFLLIALCKALVDFITWISQRLEILPCKITSLIAKGTIAAKGLHIVNVQGTLPDPKSGPYIFALDHESSNDYDTWAADLFHFFWKIVAGTNLHKFPIFNFFLHMVSIPVNRNSPIVSTKKMIRDIVRALEEKRSVGIAPARGRFRPNNKKKYRFVSEFYNGAFIAAVETGTSVVPVSYYGTGESKPPLKEVIQKRWWQLSWLLMFLKTYQWFTRATEVWRIALDPIEPDAEDSGYTDKQRVERLKWKCRTRMIKAKAYWWGVRNGHIDRATGKKKRA